MSASSSATRSAPPSTTIQSWAMATPVVDRICPLTITAVKVAFDVGPLKPRPAGVGVYVRSLANALAERPDTDLALFGRRPDVGGLPEVSVSRSRPAWMPYSIWAELVAPFALRG